MQMNTFYKIKLILISNSNALYKIYNYLKKRKKNLISNFNLIFIHIPKCAGVSINKYIFGKDIGHKTIIDYTTNKKTKILFILRDPIEKIISSLVFLTYDTKYDSDRQYSSDLKKLSYKDRLDYFKKIPNHSFELSKFIPKNLARQSYFLDFSDLQKLNQKKILKYYNNFQLRSDENEKKDFLNFLNNNKLLLNEKFKKHIDDYNFFKNNSYKLNDEEFLKYLDLLKIN